MPACPKPDPVDPLQPVCDAVEALTRAIRIATETLTIAETASVLHEHAKYLDRFVEAQSGARRKVIAQTLAITPVAIDFGRRP